MQCLLSLLFGSLANPDYLKNMIITLVSLETKLNISFVVDIPSKAQVSNR